MTYTGDITNDAYLKDDNECPPLEKKASLLTTSYKYINIYNLSIHFCVLLL